MPIQYKDGIVKEHISTRTHAGFFDVSHMGQFFLEGDQTLTESLEKIIPADLKNLKINHSKYSFLLNNEGGIIDDLIITRTEKGFCIILNAACKENDIKQISQFLKKEKINWNVIQTPMFLNSRAEFKNYLSKSKKPFMATFYKDVRKKSGILMGSDGDPIGG